MSSFALRTVELLFHFVCEQGKLTGNEDATYMDGHFKLYTTSVPCCLFSPSHFVCLQL
jgi:hypothetical protein